jgi:hypothetical protein
MTTIQIDLTISTRGAVSRCPACSQYVVLAKMGERYMLECQCGAEAEVDITGWGEITNDQRYERPELIEWLAAGFTVGTRASFRQLRARRQTSRYGNNKTGWAHIPEGVTQVFVGAYFGIADLRAGLLWLTDVRAGSSNRASNPSWKLLEEHIISPTGEES